MKNESADYFDAGVQQRLIPGFTVGVDLYYKYAHNLIDEGQFGAPIILTPFNYRLGINKGVELTTEYNVGNFTFYGNLAIANQLAKGIESAQFNFSPDDLANAGGMFVNTDHSQLKTASAGAAYLWHGTRFTVDMLAGSGLRTVPPNDTQFNGETLPSYPQVNLGISHVFKSPGGPITVRAALINLLDKVYLLRSMTGVGEFVNQYAPRRTLYVGLKKEF
jgi:outer membrane receptor protein involved in Fe transport